LVKAWILPLPETVQGQMDEAIDHGFEGMIVYIDQTYKSPQFDSAGWHNRESIKVEYKVVVTRSLSLFQIYGRLSQIYFIE
tara:strand:- start:2514 stop:2756 length:243 start_codon:yes stop_codon:yes gene_type:complete